MVDQRNARRSRGIGGPVVGGLALIAALIAVIAFRDELWRFLRRLSGVLRHWFTLWAPAHPQQTAAIAGFAVVAFILNWIAHVRGRLRAWLFVVVIEVGLWLLFWNGPGIPSLNDLFGLKLARLNPTEIMLSAILVIGITGVIFWFLEAREGWLSYRHKHSVDDD